MLRADPDATAQSVAVEEEKGLSKVPLISSEDETYEEKEETPIDERKNKAKGDVNPVILNKERVDLDDDEIKEEKPKLPKRKLKKHWSFKREHSLDKRGREKNLLGNCQDFIKRIGIVKVRQLLRKRENRKTTKVKMRKRVRIKLNKSEAELQKRQKCSFQRRGELSDHSGDKAEPSAFWDRRKRSSPPGWPWKRLGVNPDP
ncbi:hypothetical protein TNIN_469041 [Trichonephila inaurata madagascariensis]|uniref:DUF382 domain-containing protein n=1 Tax=Trichonephila inaurata madagascariensis TaxID=2747483 RepID=A0A8X6YLV6_9ARAC|nr:hypothetical protein TNIN_469041 [Trichonephila inaurata madagascariensis]